MCRCPEGLCKNKLACLAAGDMGCRAPDLRGSFEEAVQPHYIWDCHRGLESGCNYA
jgi:hypothetical protein